MRLILLFLVLCLLPGCSDPPPPDPVAVPAIDGDLAVIFRLIQEDETGSARIRLRNWMQANGEDARALFLFGLAYHQQKRYAPAEDWFARATEAEPVYPPAWHFLGWSRYYLGRPRDCEQAFRRHLELTPDEADSHYGLGLVMLDDGRPNEARRCFERSIDCCGDDPSMNEARAKAIFRLAELRELEGDDAGARRLLERAREASDRNEAAWFRLIRVCRRLGDREAAEAAAARHRSLRDQPAPGDEP